jgi:hypothetical protein
MPKHRVLAGAAVELCPEGTLGREPVSTQSADKGETMKRTLRPLAALAMLAVISAGCSNGSADSSTDTASNTGTAKSSGSSSTAASHNSTATPREKAVKFSECMRENGYPDFPDPKASGEFPTFGISVSPAVWTKCAHLSPKQLSAALKFAQCIRANGVKDFPDTVNGEPLVDTTKIPSTDRSGDPSILNAAMRKCHQFGPEGAGG